MEENRIETENGDVVLETTASALSEIPDSVTIGGSEIKVIQPFLLEDNSLGHCILAAGEIAVARNYYLDGKLMQQSDGSRLNTFYHELTHAILRTMGETELGDNEKFVSCFSSLLTEAMASAKKDESYITR